jgi:hypothetical protein
MLLAKPEQRYSTLSSWEVPLGRFVFTSRNAFNNHAKEPS